MEEYNRDSLRALRRELRAKPEKKHGSRWLTLLIILLFLFAGIFFAATHADADIKTAPKVLSEWGESIAKIFQKEENDITETVDAVLAEQNASV